MDEITLESAIGIVLNALDNSGSLSDYFDLSPEESRELDFAIEYLQDYLLEMQISKSVRDGAS